MCARRCLNALGKYLGELFIYLFIFEKQTPYKWKMTVVVIRCGNAFRFP
jgi:hypothetical protein